MSNYFDTTPRFLLADPAGAACRAVGLVCPAAAADFFAVARAVEAAAGGATGIVQRSFPQIS